MTRIVCKHKGESGFTIIELMVSMTVGLLLMAILGGMYFSTIRQFENITQKLAMNRNAREMIDILTLGGRKGGTNSHSVDSSILDRHDYIFGLRGRMFSLTPGHAAWGLPAGILAADSASTNEYIYQLGLPSNNSRPDVNASNLSAYNNPITSSEYNAGGNGVTVTCSSDDFPVSHCTSGQSVVLRGYLRMDIDFTSVAFRDSQVNAVSVPLLLISPTAYSLFSGNAPGVMMSDVYDVYWTSIHQLVERAPI